MSNYSLTWKSCNDVLAQRARTWGWALAIGAGTSLHAFPDWGRLVAELITADPDVSDPDGLFDSMSDTFSYDALIQAAKDILDEDDVTFTRRLAELLYRGVKTKAAADWPNVAKALTAASPGQLKRDKWKSFLDFVNANYSTVSALPIADAII